MHVRRVLRFPPTYSAGVIHEIPTARHWLVDHGNYCLADPGQIYAVYLPNGGRFTLQLQPGSYSVEWFSPLTGEVSPPPTRPAHTGPRLLHLIRRNGLSYCAGSEKAPRCVFAGAACAGMNLHCQQRNADLVRPIESIKQDAQSNSHSGQRKRCTATDGTVLGEPEIANNRFPSWHSDLC